MDVSSPLELIEDFVIQCVSDSDDEELSDKTTDNLLTMLYVQLLQ